MTYELDSSICLKPQRNPNKKLSNFLTTLNYVIIFRDRCTGRVSSTPRQQVNILTSYIDGSVVYGETKERNKALREFTDGKLKTGPGDLLPVSRREVKLLKQAV